CSGDKLKLAIIRACNVSSWIGDESVLNLMRQVEPIQELPQPITELIHMLQDHEAKPHEVASLIESDPQLSECLMSLVRFIHASGDEKIVDVKAAAELLGVDQLRPLILAAFGYVKFGAGCVELEAEMKHSLRVAQAARTIARFESDDSELADQAMMAGVMHRIGGLLVSQHFPESYQAIRDAAELLSDRADVERKVLSTSTAQIGGFVLCNWGLPTAVVEAVGFQDCPADATLKQFSPMIALYLARHLIDDMNGQTSEDQLDLGVLNEFGVEPRINEWKAAINESLVAIG
ncbi:MAG: HDOD domain-containing protein, partial [Planctomycetota bacterium]